MRLLAVPAAHPYPQRLRAVGSAALASPVTHLADPPVPGAPPGQWWPPPALDAQWVRDHADEVDVVHLHFGFDASSPQTLRDWTHALRQGGIPLVLTVHDVVNPHFADQGEHLARLDVLVPEAVALVTLTAGAATWIRRRWGREATVLEHPHVAPLDLVGVDPQRPRDRFVVGLHLKSVRGNVEAEPVIDALVGAVAPLPGAELVVSVHTHVLDPADGGHRPRLTALLRSLAAAGTLTVAPHDRHNDDQLYAYLRGLDLSVMPYAFGTHSGWLEACVDLGTAVLAPRTGLWVEQHPVATFGWPRGGEPDRAEIVAAVSEAYWQRQPLRAVRAQRLGQQQALARWHEQLYTSLAGGYRSTGADEVGA